MVAILSGRNRLAAFLCAAIVASLAVLSLGTSLSAALSVEVDVAAFSQRAAAWRETNIVHIKRALVQAEQLGARERQTQEEAARKRQQAQEEAARERQTQEEAARERQTQEEAARKRQQAQEEAARKRQQAAAVPGVSDPPSGGPTAEQWAALRHCESSGHYQVVSRNGRYHGAYQFNRRTWDGVAARAGRPDLVGVAPETVSPADQDAQAFWLYSERGVQPWPQCGRYLL